MSDVLFLIICRGQYRQFQTSPLSLHDALPISLSDNTTQPVNGQRLKHYIFGDSYNEDVDIIQAMTPEEFIEEIRKLQNLFPSR